MACPRATSTCNWATFVNLPFCGPGDDALERRNHGGTVGGKVRGTVRDNGNERARRLHAGGAPSCTRHRAPPFDAMVLTSVVAMRKWVLIVVQPERHMPKYLDLGCA